MILGIGVDIVEVKRIAEMYEKQGDAFLEKCFTPAEVSFCMDRKNWDQSLAARFSAKEAGMKALGTGWAHGVSFTMIEVVREKPGAPELRFHGKALELAEEMGVTNFWVSISHTDQYAVAQVILEG